MDGLYTKLQQRMEHAIAVVHEGWEKSGKRVRLNISSTICIQAVVIPGKGLAISWSRDTRWMKTHGLS